MHYHIDCLRKKEFRECKNGWNTRSFGSPLNCFGNYPPQFKISRPFPISKTPRAPCSVLIGLTRNRHKRTGHAQPLAEKYGWMVEGWRHRFEIVQEVAFAIRRHSARHIELLQSVMTANTYKEAASRSR